MEHGKSRAAKGGGDDCPHVVNCPMFGMFTLVGTLRIWQDNYCYGDHSRCERFKRSQRGESVPNTLMPNGKSLTVAPKTP